MNIETRIAKIISHLLHPLLMPTYGFALLFFTSNYISTFTPLNFRVVILIITFIFTFLLPAFNAFILLKIGRINSFEMETTRERILPYISTAMYFFALVYMFYARSFPLVVILLIAGAGLSILLTFFINFRWKISAHAIGIGGLIGAVMGISYRLIIDLRWILMLLILCAGLVGFARLKLKAHVPSQVYCGFLLGFAVELLLMLFVRY